MPPRHSSIMRVAGGAARGVRLKGPAAAGIRPTTERVRAAIFNILESGQVAGASVLDLFAGTGSLGIEALSRGAAQADFVERNRRQCAALRDNLARTGYAGIGQAHCADAGRWLAQRRSAADAAAAAYGLVLLDPPYAMGEAGPARALSGLAASGLLDAGATVVVGHSSRVGLPEAVGALRQYDRRQYGDNGVGFYHWTPSPPPAAGDSER